MSVEHEPDLLEFVRPIDEEDVLAVRVCEFRSDFYELNEWSTEFEVPYKELFEYCRLIF